jgi:hypothetical protein
MDWIQIRSRGYAINRRGLKRGDMITLLDTVTRYPEGHERHVIAKPGESLKVLSVSNAGQRGIEVMLENADGKWLVGVPAGLIK